MLCKQNTLKLLNLIFLEHTRIAFAEKREVHGHYDFEKKCHKKYFL